MSSITEIPYWQALNEICEAQNKDLENICMEIVASRDVSKNFTSELRIYILEYFWKGAHHREKDSLFRVTAEA